MNADYNSNVTSRLTVLYFIALFFDEVPRKWIEKEKRLSVQKIMKTSTCTVKYTYFGDVDSEKHRN